MFDFLDTLEPLHKLFWYVSLPVSIFFVLQTIATFVGLSDSSTDLDSNTEVATDSTFDLFTLRNLINFLLGFGWTGIAFYKAIDNKTWLVLLSTAVGLAFVALFFVLVKNIMKLSENNSFKLTDCIDKHAEVYMKIPANKSGKGKIQISVKGSVHELESLTNYPETLEVGSLVKVVAVENQYLIVDKL